jgi:hypothetical protein
MIRPCTVCATQDPQLSVRRAAIPVFQNVVYASADAARAAPQAAFDLGTCHACGFSYNASFDASLVTYDESYDNHVASAAFDTYYRSIATMLIDRFGIVDGTVYDIGCGKGEFLRVFCELAPGVRGIGIDPSCTPVRDGNFELRRTVFDASVFDGDARLVMLRHVLEHIAEPVDFLAALRAAMPAAPLFVEVPDLTWILRNNAFWDFCYEHCNYFNPSTLGGALRRAGFALNDQQSSFGDQYQWALATPGTADREMSGGRAAIAETAAYAQREAAQIATLQDRAAVAGVALWGMATKGVLLASILGDSVLGGIDMNPAKQFRFAAGTGTAIHPPEWLAELPTVVPVLAMNPNYLAEIRTAAITIRSDIVVELA